MPGNKDDFDDILQEFNIKDGVQSQTGARNRNHPSRGRVSEDDAFLEAINRNSRSFEIDIDEKKYDKVMEPQTVPEYYQKKPVVQQRKKIRKRYKGARFVEFIVNTAFVVFCIAISIYLAFTLANTFTDLMGINQPDVQIEVVIPPNSSASSIASLLHEKGIITQPFMFTLYSSFKKTVYQSGTALLNTRMGYDEIMRKLSRIQTVSEEVEIVFYEGMTLRAVANRLEEEGVCNAGEFIATLNTEDFGFEFESQIPNNNLRFTKFEGYVFPDTYNFFKGENPKSVAKKFLTNFNSKMTADLYARMAEMKMTLDETITLASVIQAESSDIENMSLVSSVFHNRLENPETYPRLESDVTIFYVERNIKPFLTNSNQALYDAYNTYKCNGLPVGPVGNPGIAAIRAALYPEETEKTYYFFLTDKLGKFYYATTLAEHAVNDRTAMKVNTEYDKMIASSKAESESISQAASEALAAASAAADTFQNAKQ